MTMKYTEEQLNSIDKSILVPLFLALQEESEKQTRKLEEMDEKLQRIMEQVVLSKQERFGRSSEKMGDYTQICFMEIDGTIAFFNEAEAVCDLLGLQKEEAVPHKKKSTGKKEQDMSGLPVHRIDHYLSEEELEAEFGKKGWKQLPDQISKRYHFTPAKVEVEEHHVGVYAGKAEERIVKAPHPKALLHGSPVSATLAAAIINSKYVNAVPLYRTEKEFERYGITVNRKNMAHWMIRLADALFVYLKKTNQDVSAKTKLGEAYRYMLNQEKYLKVFLADGEVPIDNNASERAIRGFCIGKKNWQMIDTINGAKSSAIIYSIAETAKANGLKPYEYFEYLLSVIPNHMEDTDTSFLEELLPWSETLPENIRKPKQ